MTSISSITKQYAGGLRQQQRPQKGGAGGGVLDFLGMGAKPADENKEVKVEDPVTSKPQDTLDTTDASPAAEPSLMDKALSAVGIGNKPENEEPAAADAADAADAAPAPAPAPAPAAEAPAEAPAPAPAEAPAPAAEAPAAPSMMERLTSVFKGDDAASDAGSAAASSDASSDNASSDDADSDAEEDNGVDFEKFAEEIQTLRTKYQKLKDENKELKSAKKDESSQNKKTNNSEFSKMIAAFFAIKGSVAQLEYSLKKHADQNEYPVEGLGLDDGEEAKPEEAKPEEAKPEEIVSDSGSDSGSDAGSDSGSDAGLEVPEKIPASVEEIPEIPVNAAAAPEEAPAAPAAPAAPPASEESPAAPPASEESPAAPPAQANTLFSGGKNHYVQNIKKNKTLRHHKRRNRHQTLRAPQH